MNTLLRNSLTSIPAAGLIFFMIHAANTAGLNAGSTVAAFCFLAIVGMIAAALQTVSRPSWTRSARVRHAVQVPQVLSGESTIVRFTVSGPRRREQRLWAA